MNVADIVILAVLGISVLFGMYRGFVSTVLNTGGCLISFAASFWLYPLLSGLFQGNEGLQATLLNYTDASRRIGDAVLSGKSVAGLTSGEIAEVVKRTGLPGSLGELLQDALTGRTFAGIATVEEYVSRVIVTVCINILCFVVTFLALYLAVSLIISLIQHVLQFPVLKQLDSAAGAFFGALRGIVLLFVLFTLLPMIETMMPLSAGGGHAAVSGLLEGSRLAGLVSSDALIRAIMRGRMFG